MVYCHRLFLLFHATLFLRDTTVCHRRQRQIHKYPPPHLSNPALQCTAVSRCVFTLHGKHLLLHVTMSAEVSQFPFTALTCSSHGHICWKVALLTKQSWNVIELEYTLCVHLVHEFSLVFMTALALTLTRPQNLTPRPTIWILQSSKRLTGYLTGLLLWGCVREQPFDAFSVVLLTTRVHKRSKKEDKMFYMRMRTKCETKHGLQIQTTLFISKRRNSQVW